MKKTSDGISDYTFSPWKVKDGTRVVASESMWREPLKWDREAAKAGERRRVFCASLADVFEDWQGKEGEEEMTCYRTGERLSINANGHIWPMSWPSLGDGDDWGVETYTMQHVRARLFSLIDSTPNLDWLLLTKRPENVARMTPVLPMFTDGEECNKCLDECECPRHNVWLGASVENQQTADERIPHLLRCPAAVRFLSVEPLLGPVVLDNGWNVRGHPWVEDGIPEGFSEGIDWVICGGESGPGARPCNLSWIRSLVAQCKTAGVPCFVKQLGAVPTYTAWMGSPSVPIEQPYIYRCDNPCVGRPKHITRAGFSDRKGGDWNEWPEDLRVREFPR